MAVPLVVGNWKLHGSLAALCGFAEAMRGVALDCDAALCVPFPLLASARMVLQSTPLRWGAQDCSTEDEGAYTGEVSARMVRECGARYVLVGHSERRLRHGETDGQVVEKARRVLSAGMTPIVCVGESGEERDANQTRPVLRRQLVQLMRALERDLCAVVVAYEPPWAARREGDAATPGLVGEAHAFIAETLLFHTGLPAQALRVLYGGSVAPGNAAALLATPGVCGLLVGGASLSAADFLAICRAAGRRTEARQPVLPHQL